jgi:LuxR family maltose regulon positive regulatory protein
MPHASHQIESTQLIHAKLYRPQASTHFIDRPHLLERLDEGLNHKLILVSAPPGFGKTTLASQWLAHDKLPNTWLSLDEGDNQLSQFLRYVCAAVRRRVPEACTTLQNVLTAVQLPEVDELADLLVAELSALSMALSLVLDDYHRIRSRGVHVIMRHLLRYLPAGLHLVILTRSDPPLHLQRLRLGQQLTEIRATDLCFTLAETRHFLRAQTGQPLDDTVLHSLQSRTEGWVIGLQLAGISLQSQSPQQLLAGFGGNHRLLVAYLAEEVMADLPEAVVAFLTRTALVERFCAPLGDALLAESPWPTSSHTSIAQLEAQNLFVMPLDGEGHWYRYHDLFRDFLLNRLKHQQASSSTGKVVSKTPSPCSSRALSTSRTLWPMPLRWRNSPSSWP